METPEGGPNFSPASPIAIVARTHGFVTTALAFTLSLFLQRNSGKALANKLGIFDLIKEGNGVIFRGDVAFTLVITQQLVSPKTILSCLCKDGGQ